MSIWETVGVFIGIPFVICAVIVVLSMMSREYRVPRYRPGQKWPYPPVWWAAHTPSASEGHGEREGHAAGTGELARTARGGARGSW